MIRSGKLPLVLSVLLLSGCAMLATTTPNMTDTPQLSSGEGVMVAHIIQPALDGPRELKDMVSFKDLGSVGIMNSALTLGNDNYVVIPLPAGSYQWEGLTNSPPFKMSYAHFGPMSFKIEAGKINYVGDIVILITRERDSSFVAFMHVSDMHADTLSILSGDYPKLWAAHPMVVHLTRNLSYINQ
jgi:hypothetical protein